MDEKRLSSLIKKLYKLPPIAGAVFRVKAAEELVRDGSPEAVSALAEAVSALEEAVSQSTDQQIQQIALDGLRMLAHEGCEGPAQEALCRLVIEKGHLVARNITVANGYMPKELHQRALFFFLTEQWEKYEKLDIENRFIKSIYESADDTTRKRIISTARQARRIEWVSTATGGRKGRRLSEMTEEEWNAVMSVLEYHKRWNELWLLAQKGPPFFSLKIIHKLKRSGWAPPHSNVYKKLVLIADQLDEELPTLVSLAWPLLKENANRVVTLSTSPDGRMFAEWGEESTVCLWSLPKGINFHKIDRYDTPLRRPFAMSVDGKILAGGNYNGNYTTSTCLLWSLPHYRPLSNCSTQPLHISFDEFLAITPDGKILVEGRWYNILLWSLPDVRLVETLKGHSKAISALAISSDGNILASGSKDNNICLWSLPDGKLLNTLEGHTDDIVALAISPDGQLLVSVNVGRDHKTCIWSLPDGKLLKTLWEDAACCKCIAITPDGKVLVCGNSYETTNLWSLPDGKLLKTLTTKKIAWRDHLKIRALNISISTDGRILVSTTDKTANIWNLPEGRLLKTLKLKKGLILSILISPDVRMLSYSWCGDTIRFWNTNLILMFPVIQMTLQDMRSIEEALKIDDVSKVEKNWLEFVLELVLSNRQFDILIEETTYPIETDEFDIIID